jgi:hypothetical protein
MGTRVGVATRPSESSARASHAKRAFPQLAFLDPLVSACTERWQVKSGAWCWGLIQTGKAVGRSGGSSPSGGQDGNTWWHGGKEEGGRMAG